MKLISSTVNKGFVQLAFLVEIFFLLCEPPSVARVPSSVLSITLDANDCVVVGEVT